MAKKETYTLFVVGLLLISLVVIAINQPLNLSVPAVDLSLRAPAEEVANGDQARWDAIGEFYAGKAGIRSEDAIAADQARWEAKGDFYAEQAIARSEEAVTMDQARWDAKGEFYLNQSLIVDTQ
jgi:hypothetical protein